MRNKNYQKKPSVSKLNRDQLGEDAPRGDAWKKNELFLFERKTLFVIIITSVITLLVAFFGGRGAKMLTSVLSPVPSHAPYDGMSMPIKQVPNWVKLTEGERKAAFAAIPKEKLIQIPLYNPVHLATPTTALKWNNAADDAIRNEKITYSTPYLGSYKLDGVEGVGSHPAVDIKVPEGTPIYAIANGTVIKADTGNGGFGKHIVIQHNNFPSLDDQNQKTTIYSSYSHMSILSVTTNEVVVKGEQIGFSGMTGTATTPHLHFQIDKDSAPWHPYWPFSSGDMKAAGMSFFEAINNGLRQENAVAHTINSMKYVQKYLGEQALVASTAPEVTTAIADPYENISFAVKLVSAGNYRPGEQVSFVIQAFDGNGNLLSNPTFTDQVSLSLLNARGTISTSTLASADFQTGIISNITASQLKQGRDKLLVRFRNREFSSPEFVVEETIQKANSFSFSLERSEMMVNDSMIVKIFPIDPTGARVSVFELAETLPVGLTLPSGSLNVNSLTKEQFISGEAGVVFTATQPGQTQITVSLGSSTFSSPTITVISPVAPPPESETPLTPVDTVQPVQPAEPVVTPPDPTQPVVTPFVDISVSHKYFTALTELKNAGLVAGYGDGTFKPDQSVSRAEAITFILRAIDEIVRNDGKKIFPDVSAEAWYANYVTTAFELGFVAGYPDGYFRPNSTVTYAEFFTMLFNASKVDIDPQVTISFPEGSSPTEWYAPYIQEALKKNLVTVENNTLVAGKELTRGEIAEILWKLLKYEKENENK